MNKRLLSALVCFAGFLFILGCSEGETLYDVSGTVKYDGNSIPKGLIFFDPDPTKGGSGMQGFANIIDGKFDTTQQGTGIKGGAYIIRVNGFDGKEANEAPFGQPLFPEFTEPREMPKSKSTIDLDIPKKKKR